ncbi:hypothetical protein KKB83_05475, partial [Patescibacteria group bacterium]|nr:hypothetical protein [Patescibacteria group bacterium]
LKQNQKIFHTQDLALLWQINNKNTLYTTIKRYAHKGILLRIHKGFYSTVPIEQLDPVILGISYLHTYAYLSTESVLVQNGIIFQGSNYITLISSQSKKFTLGSHNYLVRQLKDEYLFQSAGLIKEDNIAKATVERAVADILYFNTRYFFDARKLIDWEQVKKLQQIIGYL